MGGLRPAVSARLSVYLSDSPFSHLATCSCLHLLPCSFLYSSHLLFIHTPILPSSCSPFHPITPTFTSTSSLLCARPGARQWELEFKEHTLTDMCVCRALAVHRAETLGEFQKVSLSCYLPLFLLYKLLVRVPV